jgi:subtilase family serine protease
MNTHTRTRARTHAQVSLDYANRLNVEFQKAGARGISLLFASGDSGTVGMHPNHHPPDAVPRLPERYLS